MPAASNSDRTANLEVVRREFSDPFIPGSGLIQYSDDGIVYEARVDGQYAGRLMLRKRLTTGAWTIYRVMVYEDFQRQGIASALLARARADLGRVDHAPTEERTPDGMAWSQTVGSHFSGRLELDGPACCPQCVLSFYQRCGSWQDVVKKARHIRASGGITVHSADKMYMEASVVGDHDTYDVKIYRQKADSVRITHWSCRCEWGQWAFKRQHTFVGRTCSHALACYWEMRAQDLKRIPKDYPYPEMVQFPLPGMSPGRPARRNARETVTCSRCGRELFGGGRDWRDASNSPFCYDHPDSPTHRPVAEQKKARVRKRSVDTQYPEEWRNLAHSGDEWLLWRGVSDYGIEHFVGFENGSQQHRPWVDAQELLNDVAAEDRGWGQWWGDERTAKFYGLVVIAAWFRESDLLTAQDISGFQGHEGILIRPGTKGRIEKVQVNVGGVWQDLLHSPGQQVTAKELPGHD